MSDSGGVIIRQNLGEFFHSEVNQAKSGLGLNLSQDTEFYIVNMLCDFSSRGATPTPGEEPLALLYKRAMEGEPAERVQLFKDLGDISLYVAGFFAEFIERSLVGMDYYISMGGGAYSQLSQLVSPQRNGETFAEVYDKLANRFTQLVDLLNEMADRQRKTHDGELLKMYDRWARTGSERMRKRLADCVIIVQDVPTEYEQ
jgi:hypothetical protein